MESSNSFGSIENLSFHKIKYPRLFNDLRNMPTNKLRNNNVFFNHFLVTIKRNKKWRYYNVISVWNSKVPKYDVILTSSKIHNYIQQINNVIVTWWKKHHNDESKWNLIITKIPYVIQTYLKKRYCNVVKITFVAKRLVE